MSASILSVVIPIYNGAQTLAQALKSVLSQNVGDMEILVIDDGSVDATWEVLSMFRDPRLRVLRQDNRGLAATLNRGIGLAKGRYIARQDQDDLALPGRLAKQVAFLGANPDIAMVGTWAQIYSGDAPTERYHRHPCSNEALQLNLLFDNFFVHSSMMIRADVLKQVGGYCEDKSRQPPEDYELWSRIARQHRVANLPEVLTVYREVRGSMSRTGESPFLNNVIRIASENLCHALVSRYSAEDCAALAEMYHRGGSPEFRLSLTKVKARAMLDTAVLSIGGTRQGWSREFLASYGRMLAHLDSRFLRRRIPALMLAPARWLRARILRRLN